MKTLTLKEKLIAGGVIPGDISNHCSDLYVTVTPEATEVLKSYEFPMNITRFVSAIDGKLTYEIPFAYANEDYAERYRIPESRRDFVAQYASKFVEVHGNSKDMSDEVLSKTFEDCALPLRAVFYPMCREEILRRQGE